MPEININFTSVIRILLLLVGLWLVYTVADVLLLIFIAVILTSALNPLVDYLETKKVKRGIGTALIFGGFLIVLGLLAWFLIPPMALQINRFFVSIPSILERTLEFFNLNRLLGEQTIQDSTGRLDSMINQYLTNSSVDVLRFGLGLFDGMLSAFTVIVLTFYMLSEHSNVREFILGFAPADHKHKAGEIFRQVEMKLGVWLRGQLLVMLLIGVITYIGLSILQIEFALPLAILAGLFEIVPFIGPTIATIPALVIAFNQSPWQALSVGIFAFVLQQLESSLVVPKVMNQAVGLNPIVVIIAIMVGARLYGPLGALLSIPLAAVLILLYQEWKKFFDTKSKTHFKAE
jgi:predicted PurR-regulated permease PerM